MLVQVFRLGGWAQAEWCHLSAAAALARPPDKRAANELLANDVELSVCVLRYAWEPIQACCMYAMWRARVGWEFDAGGLVCWGIFLLLMITLNPVKSKTRQSRRTVAKQKGKV
jgi:hypothetical protein